MPVETVEYHFGRLNLIATYTDKAQFLLDSLTTHVEVESYGYRWGVFSVGQRLFEDRTFIHGLLVKFKPTEEDIVDERTHSLATALVPNKAQAKSSFFLEPKSGVIAFRPVAGISHRQFKYMFARLIEEANDNLLINAEVQSIDEQREIVEALKRFDQIRLIKVVLHPSNPNNREIWKKTDERLREMRVRKFREVYIGDDIKVGQDSEVLSDIIMAGDGYGYAEIRGLKDGQPVVASTEEVAVTQQVPRDADDEGILRALWNRLCEIWKRV